MRLLLHRYLNETIADLLSEFGFIIAYRYFTDKRTFLPTDLYSFLDSPLFPYYNFTERT